MTERSDGSSSTGLRVVMAGMIMLSIVLTGLLIARGRSRSDSSGSESSSRPLRSGQTVHPTDGSVLIPVDGGAYSIGTATADLETLLTEVHRTRPSFPRVELEDETPAHTVSLKPFFIGQHEVTNAQYRKFVAASGSGSMTNNRWEEAAEKNGESAPVVQVTWKDAKAYCIWAGLRLPTEEEWEAAARGTEGRKYPWGSSGDPSRCRCSVDTRVGSPADVGSLPSGDTPQGVSDMAGNVWEWTESAYVAYPGYAGGRNADFRLKFRVIRGGAFNSASMEMLRSAHRYRDDPEYCSYNLGFRVAKDR